eukprot:Clim_evm12s228 gene=Clim_evmTU12s228
MKSVFAIATLAIVSSVSAAAATGQCVAEWGECNGTVDNCCLGTYCAKANLTDKSTKCIPYVPEGEVCSTDGKFQDWICADYMQCINNVNGTEGTCQEASAGQFYCGFDSRADAGYNLVHYNAYCDAEKQYCGINANSRMPECYEGKCIEDWQPGCQSDAECCNDNYYCGIADVGGKELSCIVYVPEGGICHIPEHQQSWKCEAGTACLLTQGVYRCLA